MENLIKEILYNKLQSDKIKISWNKNPIKIELFLSFLKIEVVKIKEHLGYYTGWTRYENNENKLIITGGIVNDINYLDSIQFGDKLSNPYNNFVNPFYLFEILTYNGKKFFIEYYKDDINKIISDKINKIQSLKDKLNNEKSEYNSIIKEMNFLIELSK